MADTGEQDRAIGYVRVSTLRQAEEGDSLANQTETITQYARGRGLDFSSRDIIIDDGVSAGIPIWERKGGKRLLKKIQTGRYSHVIVTKIDRMFRLTGDAILTIDDLENMGIDFHTLRTARFRTRSTVGPAKLRWRSDLGLGKDEQHRPSGKLVSPRHPATQQRTVHPLLEE